MRDSYATVSKNANFTVIIGSWGIPAPELQNTLSLSFPAKSNKEKVEILFIFDPFHTMQKGRPGASKSNKTAYYAYKWAINFRLILFR